MAVECTLNLARPFGQKKSLLCCFGPFFGNFGFPVETLVTFSRKLSNFEKNPDKTREKNPFFLFFFFINQEVQKITLKITLNKANALFINIELKIKKKKKNCRKMF